MTDDLASETLAAAIENHDVWLRPASTSHAVVLAHFNPCGYRRPVQNLLETLNHLKDLYADVYLGYARLTDCDSSYQLFGDGAGAIGHRVRVVESDTVWFHKEPLWDMVVRTLVPHDVTAVLLLDADVRFSSVDRVDDIFAKAGVSRAAHPFSHVSYLDPSGRVVSRRTSMGKALSRGEPDATDPRRFQAGFGMVLHRNFWRDVGNLFLAPVGGGDTMLCAALAGKADQMQGELTDQSIANWSAYKKWAEKVSAWSNTHLAVADVEIYHRYHGSHENRMYDLRRTYLVGFDPTTDVVQDANGLPQWSSSARRMKADMVTRVEQYFALRREDD